MIFGEKRNSISLKRADDKIDRDVLKRTNESLLFDLLATEGKEQ